MTSREITVLVSAPTPGCVPNNIKSNITYETEEEMLQELKKIANDGVLAGSTYYPPLRILSVNLGREYLPESEHDPYWKKKKKENKK